MNNRNKNGGEAIASGGFGCVFKPALKCKNSNNINNGVTKLLLNNDANKEINEILTIKDIIKTIPNYDKYFLGLDIYSCTPDTLSQNDKINLDSKCNNLIKNNINSNNINNNLNKLKGINLPYGGLEFKKFFIKNFITPETFTNVNNSMINLIKYGIKPMNNLNIFHFDLKGPNILISDDFNTRIIDWGLSGIQTNNKIPDSIINRPLMYNAPFSICVFNTEFKIFVKKYIGNLLNKLPGQISSLEEIRNDIKIFMIKWIYKFIQINGPGHYEYILSLIELIQFIDFNKFPHRINIGIQKDEFDELLSYYFINELFANELTEIVVNFTNLNAEFNDEQYFNHAFKYNIDIWGLLTSYYNDLITVAHDSKYTKLNEKNIKLIFEIRKIAYKYLFDAKSLIHPININTLCDDLQKLNNIVNNNTRQTNIINNKQNKSLQNNSLQNTIIYRNLTTNTKKNKTSKKNTQKKRKQRVTCDENKIRKCNTLGKICNIKTGRCNKK